MDGWYTTTITAIITTITTTVRVERDGGKERRNVPCKHGSGCLPQRQ